MNFFLLNTNIWCASALLLTMLLVLFLSVRKKKLTALAGVTAAILGLLVLLGAGLTGAFMLIAFFVLGVLASRYKRSHKKLLTGILHSEERNAVQVLANGGVAGVCALLVFMDPPHAALYVFLMAGSLASATADTISSEIGTVHGTRFVNVLTGKRETPGTDGVISLEGTLAGLSGATMIALIYGAGLGATYDVFYIMAAGVLGNLADSVLGASLQRRGWLNNDAVNACNTAIGSIIALALKLIFG